MTARRLTLFVSGASLSSRRARENLTRLKLDDLPEGWEIEIVDVQSQPDRAEEAQILATPTLSDDDQLRPRRIVGDLSDRAKVLDFLGIDRRDA